MLCLCTAGKLAHHREYAWTCVFPNKVFVSKPSTIYAETPSTISLRRNTLPSYEWLECSASAADGNIAHLDKVSTLYHEAFNDSMKGTALVTN